ncbi:hypothetical protein ACOME3_004112 [Neoechinorhynchus agilis]
MDIEIENPKRNQLGGSYCAGKAIPTHKRLEIIRLFCEGKRASDISRLLQISHGCVSKILTRYKKTGQVHPGPLTNILPSSESRRSSNRRPRAVFDHHQLQVLEYTFDQIPNPSKLTREQLSCQLNVPENIIQNWFSNRRAKERRKNRHPPRDDCAQLTQNQEHVEIGNVQQFSHSNYNEYYNNDQGNYQDQHFYYNPEYYNYYYN